MTVGLKRFEQIVDAYGVDPRRWPPDERQAAEVFMQSSAEARALVATAAELDDWLDQALIPAPSELAERRVLKAAPRAQRAFGWTSGAGWAAAAAAGLVLGVSMGHYIQATDQAYEALDQATTWSVDESEYFG